MREAGGDWVWAALRQCVWCVSGDARGVCPDQLDLEINIISFRIWTFIAYIIQTICDTSKVAQPQGKSTDLATLGQSIRILPLDVRW